MRDRQKSVPCHGHAGINRRGFLGSVGAAAAAAMLLDDLLCLAADSLPAAGPDPAGGGVVVEAVPVWPAEHEKTGRMDAAYGTDSYNYQWKLYQEILAKASIEVGVAVRCRAPVTTQAELERLLEDLKQAPPGGLIVTCHTLSDFGHGSNWYPIQKIVDGRGEIPTVVYTISPQKGFSPPVRYGKPFTYTCVEPDPTQLEALLRLVSAPARLKQARILYADPRPAEKDELENVQSARTRHELGPAFVHVPNYLELYQQYEMRDEIRKLAEHYRTTARKVVEPGDEEVLNAAKHYFVLRDLMRERHCQGAVVSGSICTGAPGLPGAGPACVAISRLCDEGFPGTCEGNQDFSVACLVSHLISGRPSTMGNAGLCTFSNLLQVQHCYSPTKLRGPKDEYRAPYQLRDFHGRQACCLEVFWPAGEQVTFVTPLSDPIEYAVGTGHVIGNAEQPPQFNCRTSVKFKVDGLDNWDTHTFRCDKVSRFTTSYVLGDMRERYEAFGQLAGVKTSTIVEARKPAPPGQPIIARSGNPHGTCPCSCAHT